MKNNKPKLLYYKILNFQPENIELLRENFNVLFLENPIYDDIDILKEIEIIFAPLGFMLDEKKIDLMSNLKVIASNTTGEPHIDCQYAEKKGICVISLKNDQEFLSKVTSTAEHAWGLTLALVRRTPWAFQSVLEGDWNRRLFGGKSMFSNMSIGIVGLGRLGKMIAQYASCFKMKSISYYDPYVSSSDLDEIIRIEKLEDLVSRNDIISIHVPSNKSTLKLFDKYIFSKFKNGSYLINTSRAEIVDEEAMIQALKDNVLSGAAVDVFSGEFKLNYDELLKKSELLRYAKKYDNLLITPHIGGSTIDAWKMTEKRTVDKIIDFFDLNK